MFAGKGIVHSMGPVRRTAENESDDQRSAANAECHGADARNWNRNQSEQTPSTMPIPSET